MGSFDGTPRWPRWPRWRPGQDTSLERSAASAPATVPLRDCQARRYEVNGIDRVPCKKNHRTNSQKQSPQQNAAWLSGCLSIKRISHFFSFPPPFSYRSLFWLSLSPLLLPFSHLVASALARLRYVTRHPANFTIQEAEEPSFTARAGISRPPLPSLFPWRAARKKARQT